MVDDVVGKVPESVERRRRVKVHRDGRAEVLELPDTLDAGGLVEVGAADSFTVRSFKSIELQGEKREKENAPDDVPVGTAGDDVELLMLHDVEKLSADLTRLAERLGVEEVTSCPGVGEAVSRNSRRRGKASIGEEGKEGGRKTHPFDFHCV